MKRTATRTAVWMASLAVAGLFNVGLLPAQDVQAPVDETIIGGSVTTTAPDADNDGVPNGLDVDFVKGTGLGMGSQIAFIDEDGDGICDTFQNNAGTQAVRGRLGLRQNQSAGAGLAAGARGKGAGKGNAGSGICIMPDATASTDGVIDTPGSAIRARHGQNRNK